jgi:hypothetical protein
MLTLTNVRGTDGTMKNGQSAETGNIRHTRHRTEKDHRKLNRRVKRTTTKTRGDISSINDDLNHHLNIRYI